MDTPMRLRAASAARWGGGESPAWPLDLWLSGQGVEEGVASRVWDRGVREGGWLSWWDRQGHWGVQRGTRGGGGEGKAGGGQASGTETWEEILGGDRWRFWLWVAHRGIESDTGGSGEVRQCMGAWQRRCAVTHDSGQRKLAAPVAPDRVRWKEECGDSRWPMGCAWVHQYRLITNDSS